MQVRKAVQEDAGRIAELLAQLGYGATPDLVRHKLSVFHLSQADDVLVAERAGSIVGVISLHVLELFHAEGRLGRITALVIDAAARGEGVGAALVSAAQAWFQQQGCVRAEVTSGDHRPDAHAFYEAMGFRRDERRFVRRF